MAEEEIGADPHFDTRSQSTSTVRTNISGIPLRHLVREADDGDALHAGARQRLEPLLGRHQQRRRLVGPDHARRMRIEGHRRRRAAALAGAAPHAVDDLDVAAVQAVEVAEREHGIVPARRRVVGKVRDHTSQVEAPGRRRLRSDIQHEAIIGERDAVGQPRVGRRVRRSWHMCVK